MHSSINGAHHGQRGHRARVPNIVREPLYPQLCIRGEALLIRCACYRYSLRRRLSPAPSLKLLSRLRLADGRAFSSYAVWLNVVLCAESRLQSDLDRGPQGGSAPEVLLEMQSIIVARPTDLTSKGSRHTASVIVIESKTIA